MFDKAGRKPRIVVVEDERMIRERLRRIFERPPIEFQTHFEIDGFTVDVASSASEATDLFHRANEEGFTYTFAWLDLGIPKDGSDSADDPSIGIDLVRQIRPIDCHELIVASAHNRSDVLLELLKTRMVADFVTKPWDDELQVPLKAAGEAYRRVQATRWKRIAEERSHTQLPKQIKSFVADKMMRIMTGGINEVKKNIDRATKELTRVRGITDDGQMSRFLQAAAECSDRTVQGCRIFQQGLSTSGVYGPTDVCELMTAIVNTYSVVPGKAIDLDLGDNQRCQVDTFAVDLREILSEMLFGALIASPPDAEVFVEVRQNADNWTVDVQVRYDGPGFTEAERDRILTGEPSVAIDRISGLALAQRQAHNIGTAIELPSSDFGNVVILRIPVTYDE